MNDRWWDTCAWWTSLYLLPATCRCWWSSGGPSLWRGRAAVPSKSCSMYPTAGTSRCRRNRLLSCCRRCLLLRLRCWLALRRPSTATICSWNDRLLDSLWRRWRPVWHPNPMKMSILSPCPESNTMTVSRRRLIVINLVKNFG